MQHTTDSGYGYSSVPTLDGRPPFAPALLARSRDLLEATLLIIRSLTGCSDPPARIFDKYPVHADRARSAAVEIGVPAADVMAANLCYDTFLGSGVLGCSTLALPGPHGPVLARNMDWFPAAKIAKASCLVREEFGLNAGFIGMLGSATGLSKRGFGICLNEATGGTDPDGYPMLLFLRHVLDTASDFDDALAVVEREPLMSSGIITVVGTTNRERAIVERLPRKSFVRTAKGKEPLIATNHFLRLARPEYCSRYEFMSEQREIRSPLEVLTNQRVLQEITAQYVVMCPAENSIEMYVPSHLLPEDVHDDLSIGNLSRFFS